MKIFITCPTLIPHGGIRVILEWANRLSRNHIVFLQVPKFSKCDWFVIDRRVNLVVDESKLKCCDCLIISSPHHIHYQDLPQSPPKTFLFMQMLEHMFRLDDVVWQEKCNKFYLSYNPIIAISKWNINYLLDLGRKGKIHYVGNGVNLEDFPISYKKKDRQTVLVEGWTCLNPTKDVCQLGKKASIELKRRGHRIISYSQVPLVEKYEGYLDEFYLRPSVVKLNEINERATILLKASLYDARSTSPMEAMTKGTVTARAIFEGDDDLVHMENCLRGVYSEKELLENSLRLLEDNQLFDQLSDNCREYVKKYTWSYWMLKIEDILRPRSV